MRGGNFVRRYFKLFALTAIFAVVAAACGDDGGETPGTTGPEQTETEPALQPGGTLRLNLLSDDGITFDPQQEYYSVTWAMFRCCLLRTMMSYLGLPTEQDGTTVYPDLAAEEPVISADGLTWTFTVREGLTFAPPYQDVPITAEDFVRALERELNPDVPAGYPFYYSDIIEGATEYVDGEADTISGLVADGQTLEVRLTHPVGDLGYRFAMAATAPIPEGAAEGHNEDYGRVLAASGPYMFEGADQAEPGGDEPFSGFDPGRQITFVRNPSWQPETDPLRGEFAYADEIDISVGGTEEDNAAKIDNNELDLQFDGVSPAEQIQRYLENPDLQERVFINPSDAIRYLSMNVAQPPFDDINVRKALNFAIDKEGMRRLRPGGELAGEIAGHIMVPGVLGELLADYDRYPTPNNQGDLEAAQEAMRASAYDSDGDGVCDDPACENVLAVTDEADPYPEQAALISENLEAIGITLNVRQFERGTMYENCNDPAAKVPICLAPGWGKDYANGTTFAEPLFGDSALGPESCCNYSLVGASPEQLQEWGYETTEVPSVDDAIAECDPLTGDEQTQCWADLDVTVMEEVVPWIPYLFDNYVKVTSENVLNYTFDQFAGLPALEKLALADAQGA
jgi:peptide/nickel transport system substrate-binding protein